MDTQQYLSPNSSHSKIRSKNISIGVADRIRKNCSGNIINDITYRKRLILVKSGNSKKDIDKVFCKRAKAGRRETLRKKSTRIIEKHLSLNMNHNWHICVIFKTYGERQTTF